MEHISLLGFELYFKDTYIGIAKVAGKRKRIMLDTSTHRCLQGGC